MVAIAMAGTRAQRCGWVVHRVVSTASSAQPAPNPTRAAPVMTGSAPPVNTTRTRTSAAAMPASSDPTGAPSPLLRHTCTVSAPTVNAPGGSPMARTPSAPTSAASSPSAASKPAAAAHPLQLDDRPHAPQQQEPHPRVRERGLHLGVGVPAHGEHDAAGDQQGEHPEEVADLHQHRQQQRDGDPEQQGDPVSGQQPRPAEPEQGGGEIAGEQRQDHAEPGGTAGGEGQPRGVRVQADAAQLTAAEDRDQGVTTLMGDGDGVAGDPPRQPGRDHQQRDQSGEEHQQHGQADHDAEVPADVVSAVVCDGTNVFLDNSATVAGVQAALILRGRPPGLARAPCSRVIRCGTRGASGMP